MERSGIDQMQLMLRHLGRMVNGQAPTQCTVVKGLFAEEGISAGTVHPLVERFRVTSLCFQSVSNPSSLQKQLVRRVDRRCGSSRGSRDAPSPPLQANVEKGGELAGDSPSPLPLFHA